MHNKLSSWLSLFAFLALVISHAAAQGPAPAAAAATAAAATTQLPGTIRVSRVVGKVTAEDIATKVVKDLANDVVIGQGSIVRTEANSSVVLLFSNGASINLAAISELNILTFTQDPFAGTFEPSKETDEPSISTTNIMLTRGELVGNVKKLKKGGPVESKFTVGTPVGAAGIRGTTFRIVYRPSGDGRTYNFTMTTLEGNVEVSITGTVNAPPVSVTDNKEVVLNNVEVNATTNQVTATTATGQTVSVAAAPASTDAPPTTLAQVNVVAQQLAQEILNKVFTTPTTNNTTNNNTNNTTPPPDETKKDPPPEDKTKAPGTTTQPNPQS
jgi:hypothetical protein